MLVQAVFIDRDGTIGGSNQVEFPGEFQLFPKVKEALHLLKENEILIVSFTNQPGISRGEAHVEDFVKELQSIGFEHVYLCPHGQEAQCNCRKPNTGMLQQAAIDLQLDLTECIVIGDRWKDMLAAHRVHTKKILVKTGAGSEDLQKFANNEYFGEWAEVTLDYIADSFYEAVEWIVTSNTKRKRHK
ncbi:HAD-IIIA family hydrolase [Caldibacillus lycopersici]|uniref:D,D-heptose 1,7-bisphosphate phosphatase n=1 Tax=Perspicuibacillus lycopersici TaxID=1325689 RepID=A0AAE3IWN7_9BACI|nr:HAD-IIIA family hydrolase [Perspicuibacillus lycopersici]MCU9614766.1 HAD-IIIA family hydrolase [Perspicuibacillus lycopersici]